MAAEAVRGQGQAPAAAALAAALEIAERSGDFAMAAQLAERLRRGPLSDGGPGAPALDDKMREDLRVYEDFFEATEVRGFGGRKGPGQLVDPLGDAQLDDWLRPLLQQQPGLEAAGSREHVMMLAEREGVELFRVDGDPTAAARAARQFHEQGFCLVADVLRPHELTELQAAAAELIRVAVRKDRCGNRGRRRYSLGRTTVVDACLEPAGSPQVCEVLRHIWQSDRFTVQCTGGDFSLPGAEVQDLHIDMPPRRVAPILYAFHDPMHPGRGFLDLPAPVVKVYFPLVDFDEVTGPPRFVPGTQWRAEDVPPPGVPEPPSVLAFCPKGSALLMDQRVWHGGTPNRSDHVRPMLSVHYAGPWYNEAVLNDGGGMQYYRYHQGAVPSARLASMPAERRRLLQHLGPPAGAPERCERCGKPVACGRTALPGINEWEGHWFCVACWSS